jgi:hypothetical protein
MNNVRIHFLPRDPTVVPTTVGDPEKRRQEIAEIAFALGKRRGLAPGHELDDWLSAEREVDARIAALAPRL